MFRCSRESAWPKALPSAERLSVGLLVICAPIVAQSRRRAITARQYEEFGHQFRGAMKAALGTELLTNSPTQSVPRFATVHRLADSLASRSIPERLSAIWSGVCQNISVIWHSAYHLATIASGLAVKAYSIIGGITHRM